MRLWLSLGTGLKEKQSICRRPMYGPCEEGNERRENHCRQRNRRRCCAPVRGRVETESKHVKVAWCGQQSEAVHDESEPVQLKSELVQAKSGLVQGRSHLVHGENALVQRRNGLVQTRSYSLHRKSELVRRKPDAWATKLLGLSPGLSPNKP